MWSGEAELVDISRYTALRMWSLTSRLGEATCLVEETKGSGNIYANVLKTDIEITTFWNYYVRRQCILFALCNIDIIEWQ